METRGHRTIDLRELLVSLVASVFFLLSSAEGVANGQATGRDCAPYRLNGTVFECDASGSPLSQLRTATYIAGSEAAGEALARAMALEVGTAPFGSSSGGFTFTFEPSIGTFQRRAATFGPAFSERALTIGKGRLSGGFNFLYRSYDRMDELALDRFNVVTLQGGTVPVASTTFDLQARTQTLAGFADYGVLSNLDVGVLVPYVRISVTGASHLQGPSADELKRVLINASAAGLGDIAIFAKYRFWNRRLEPAASGEVQGGLAAEVTVRIPSGNDDDLIGLGVTRTLVALIGSTTAGRLSPHVNVGYEIWSRGVDIRRDFQESSTVTAKDQAQYSGGLEYDLHPKLSLMVDVLGRYQRGAGGVGYQPYVFTENIGHVAGAEALVAVPSGVNTVLLAPGAKWNVFRTALLTMNLLVPMTHTGLRTRVTPVVGIDWTF
jgi:hypothetical protein